MRGSRFVRPGRLVAVVLVLAAALPGCKKSGGTDAERAIVPAAEVGEAAPPVAGEAGPPEQENPADVAAEEPGEPESPAAGEGHAVAADAAADAGAAVPGREEDRMVRGDGYEGVILPASEREEADGTEPWMPTPGDVAAAERLVREQLSGMTASPEYQQGVITEVVARLPEYRRQYVPRRGPEGHRVLWINLFRSGGFPDWTESLVSVRGGGHDYFNLEVDLDAGECRALQINSPR